MVFTPDKTIETKEVAINVIKRCGTSAPLDITRIRDVVNWACRDLNANPIELEAGLKMRLRDGVTTREIQENLIQCALEMCSPEKPDWRYVAGRLHIWSLWKDTLVERGSQYGEYAEVVAKKVASGAYDERLLEYSSEELDEAGWWINADWDLDYDYAGAVLLTKRYLLEHELPQEAFLTCALLLAIPEKPKNRLKWARKFYEAIATRKVSLATPILANLRVPNGSLSSCFIISFLDNLESIYREITNAARISKNGGGVGCVDGETEFLTPSGWIKFCDYDPSTPVQVAQYVPETDAISFVAPSSFIKEKNEYFHFFKTKYGISQKICDDHRVLYYAESSKKQQKPITGANLASKFQGEKGGFRGVIRTAFTRIEGQAEPLDYPENTLRLVTAIQADGTFPNQTNRCVFMVKKKRKAIRLQELLEDLDIEYKLVMTGRGYFHYSFISPVRIKHFPSNFYQLSVSQLGAIAEECLHWDGTESQGTFFTRTESDADFIQFAMTSQGLRASKALYHREDGDDFVVKGNKNPFAGFRIDHRSDRKIYRQVVSSDGYKYCFEVPSGALMMRHEGVIFMTHNCNLSNIRATGATVMGHKNASGGVIPWIKLLNDTAIAVNQGKQFCPLVA